MAINIDLVADASKAIKEAGNLGTALGRVADDLDDVGKEGKDTDRKVSDAFRDMSKDAKTAGDNIERDAAGAFRGLADTARTTGRTVGDAVTDGTDRAGDGLSELGSEAAGTARETAASFGSIEDAAGALQEVAANAFAGFGPAGMAAGLVAAAGIGLAISALTDQADQINANKEDMLSLAQTIRDNGGVLKQADYVAQMEEYGYAIQDTKEWFDVFQTDAVSGFEQLRQLAKDTGLTARDMFKGGFGNKDEAKATLDLVQDRLDRIREKKQALMDTEGVMLNPVDNATLDSLEKSEELIQKNITGQEQAAEVERFRRQAIEGTTEALMEDIKAQEESEAAERDRRQYIDGTTEALERNLRKLEERADALKGSITTDLDYRDGIEELNQKLTDNGLTVDVNTAKGRDNQRAILDQASAIEEMAKASLLAGDDVGVVTGKFQAQKDALVAQVTPAFGGSQEAARLFIEQILKTPSAVVTDVNLDGIPDAEQQLSNFTTKTRSTAVQVNPATDGGGMTALERHIAGLQNTTLYVDVRPKNGAPINA